MLDLHFIRSQFPSLSGEWTFFDNAGGTQAVRQVEDRFRDYLFTSNVQHGASYDVSKIAAERVAGVRKAMTSYINAQDASEIILGPSTTQLLQNLAGSLVQILKPGDEVIVTNCDHEANIGPWIRLEKAGIRVKIWKIDRDSMELRLEDLERIMSPRTRLVAFTHVSNILGTIHPVKKITSYVHDRGALVCVDGVAYAPHRMVDVQDMDVDFYAFSFYKVYGPHYSLLYGKREHLEKLPGVHHFFIGEQDIPYKFQPGNVNYEISYSLLGILDYYNDLLLHHDKDDDRIMNEKIGDLFSAFADHEEKLGTQLLSYLGSKKSVRIIGNRSSEKEKRVPTISFIVDGKKSSEVPLFVDRFKIGIRWGDFYARRLTEDLGLMPLDGVVRVSMVHYNTVGEVESLIYALDHLL